MAELAGKVALITGASSGLGRRFAEHLAHNGARVALTGRRLGELSKLQNQINKNGGDAFVLEMDVRSSNSVATGIEGVVDKVGPIDILINNAGISIEKFITDTTEDDYDSLIGTNLKGAWLVAHSVGLSMISAQRGGRIVNIASVLGYNVIPMLSLYCMSKAGIIQMTKSMALEWARYNIQVNAIAPGFIETEINRKHFRTKSGKDRIARWPNKRIGEPADLDGAMMLLVGASSRFITGSVVTVDDGQSLKGF